MKKIVAREYKNGGHRRNDYRGQVMLKPIRIMDYRQLSDRGKSV